MTKITKKNLIKSYSPKLKELGYSVLEDSFTIANGLFYKKIKPDLILCLGFTISSYSNRYTADFYLSKGYEFGYMLKDFPRNAYLRISYFLTLEERREIFNGTEWTGERMTDAWWDDLNESSVNSFINVLNCTESRFLKQDNLFKSINLSEKFKEFMFYIEETRKNLHTILNEKQMSYKYLPTKNTENVPIEWFQSAEMVLKEHNPKLIRETYVKLLGINAWRYYNL